MWLTNHFPELRVSRVSLCELSRFLVDFLTTFDQDDFLQTGRSIGCLRFWREWRDTHLVGRFSLICHVPTLQVFLSATIQQLPQQLVKYWIYSLGAPLNFGGEFLLVAAAYDDSGIIGSDLLQTWYVWSYFLYPQCHTCWFMLILLDILFADWIENLRRRWRKRDRMRQINMIKYDYCKYD